MSVKDNDDVLSADLERERQSVEKKKYLTSLGQNIKVGIIGGTNIGKSILFNALVRNLRVQSIVDNALFTTIDPYATQFVPEDRMLDFIEEVNPSISNVTKSLITVIDTAGIVENSYQQNRGVGVSSLSTLEHCDVFLHVLRCFDSDNLAHYDEQLDPVRDIQIVEQELMQIDLYKVEKVLAEIEVLFQDIPHAEYLQFQHDTYCKLWEYLAGEKRPTQIRRSKRKTKTLHMIKLPATCAGQPLRFGNWDLKEREVLYNAKLLTTKEVIYLANISAIDYVRESAPRYVDHVHNFLDDRDDTSMVMNISMELEDRLLHLEQRGELEQYYNLNPKHMSACGQLLQTIYLTLSVVKYYIISDTAIRCWYIRQGGTVLDAANMADINVARNMQRADVITFEDYQSYNGNKLHLQMEGKIRPQGRKYVINDGDIVDFVVAAHKKQLLKSD